MKAPFAWLLALVAPLSLAGEPEVPAPTPLDARVVAALETAGLGHADDAGDFRLIYRVGDERSQVVWIASKTARITQLEIRDIWSLAYRGEGAAPAEVARRLLTENARMVLGAWQVNQAPDRYLVVYLAQVPADTDAESLREAIEAVAVSADRMERELTGADEF